MTIKIANVTMPTSMNARALRYNFQPFEILARNGYGAAITSNNGASLEWTWASLNGAEYDWLVATLLLNAASREDATTGGTVVYNNKRVEQTFNHCHVLYPQYKLLSGTQYLEVTLVVDQLW